MKSPLRSKPILTALAWQAAATLALAALGGLWAGWNGALSAALGGGITLVASVVYAVMGGIVRPATAMGALAVLLRAEAFKVALILVQLALVFKLYHDLSPLPFILAFIVTTLLFGIALRVRT